MNRAIDGNNKYHYEMNRAIDGNNKYHYEMNRANAEPAIENEFQTRKLDM
jgi:hypothetical protein